MINETRNAQTRQCLHLCDRRTLTVSGTEDVIAFDESTVTLRTALGDLHVDGSELHIVSLNAGEEKGTILIEGNIAGLFYEDESQRRKTGLFGRRA